MYTLQFIENIEIIVYVRVSQGGLSCPPGGKDRYSGATSSKGTRGGMEKKEPKGAIRSFFNTYTRYSWVPVEEQ